MFETMQTGDDTKEIGDSRTTIDGGKAVADAFLISIAPTDNLFEDLIHSTRVLLIVPKKRVGG
jgi:hypothetical protein